MIAVYDKLIYFNEASKYTILRMPPADPSAVSYTHLTPPTTRDVKLAVVGVSRKN